jgi:hypothetical protein
MPVRVREINDFSEAAAVEARKIGCNAAQTCHPPPKSQWTNVADPLQSPDLSMKNSPLIPILVGVLL